MASWTTTILPQVPRLSDYSETMPNLVIRTQTEIGPAKVRKRFTSAERPFKLSMILTSSQATAFDAFFVDTCDGGATQFTWVHPRTQSTGANCRFVGQPTFTAVDGGYYQVDFEMEILP